MRTILAARAAAILYDVLLGLENKKTFLLPANICPIVPITFFKAHVPIELVDITAGTLNLDLDETESRLRRRPGFYGGLLYAHTYGDPSTPTRELQELKARFPGLLLIDDRCLCIPEFGSPNGAPADVTLYSTGYAKIVDVGFGGYAFLQDRVKHVPNRLRYDPADLTTLEAGYKRCIDAGEVYSYRDSDWLQAETEMPAWDEYRRIVQEALQPSLDRRGAINAVYNSRIPPELQLPQRFQLWRFNLRTPRKRQILQAIFAGALFASSHYASLDGIMGSGGGQNARKLAEQVINLFNDQHYSVEMAEKTADIVLRSL